MPFIGQEPISGAFHKLDAITTSATATYNLQLNGGAYSPASANHLLVSLNGVIQAPQDSFTVSGSQITFDSALTSSDSIDFIMAYGDVLNIGTPSDGTVNTNSIVNSAVTDAKIAGMSSSKLTGALPALDGSALTGAGGLVKLEHISVDAAGATDYAFNFTDVFSTTYDDYFFQFHVASYQTTGSENVANTFYAQFGNNGTYVTANNTTRGANRYLQHDVTAAGNGQQYYYSTMGIHQLLGTLTTTENGVFSGTGIIKGVNTTYWPTQIIINNAMMQYFTTQANTWMEWTASREDNSTKNSYTDVRFGIIQGDSNGGNLNSANSRRDAYGEMTIYGMAK